MQYLYNDGDLYYFMNNETYNQIIVTSEIVTLRVIKTEPAVDNQSSGNTNKLAAVETGTVVAVPSFIEEDDIISIITHCEKSYGDYIGRKEE